ncbi:MAG TPA: glycoside hydrolase family 27 protein, partial [Polyangia bacterium]
MNTAPRLLLTAALVAVGCSGTTTSSTGGAAGEAKGGAGGSFGGGGAPSSGGSKAAGGTGGAGGSVGTAGVAASGGTTGSGGRSATGGTSSVGGSDATAGSTASGGRAGTGGGSASGGNATGGRTGAGGIPATGGSGGAGAGGTAGPPTGGETGSGGVTAKGGSTSTGGAVSGGATGSDGAANGGSTSTGGARAGGTTGTGGTLAAGGTGGSTTIGATPPMGWNSWNAFNCSGLNESVVKSMADAFITTGMKDVGYQYVNLDDCWMDGRDGSGKLKASTSKFPSGIAALADYIHGKGLKIGIYSTPNTKTCAGIYGGYAGGVGSVGHETTDAQTWASWGIDYLKYDKCQGQLSAFATMGNALKATGRSIFYSINPADQGPYCVPSNCSINLVSIANMWRIEFDISAKWSEVVRLIDADKPEYSYVGPGHWNDPDMLEVGNGLGDTEGRA